jgi:L-ascorbate metabolism protein UlaG (beta-lactamase superfamily)
MRSFVSSPHIHINAVKDPIMRGGPFIHYNQSEVGAIKSLLEETIKEQAHMLEFAEAVKLLDNQLTNAATGYSLESMYQNIPSILRGYVELVYDLNNHPSIRFLEGVLYNSRFYNPRSQSIILSNNFKRGFVFSTPRLAETGSLRLNIPFNSEAVDELCQMRHTPKDISYICELLGVDGGNSDLISSFFTESSPHKEQAYSDSNVRVRYYGHACILIESKEVSILCDPLIGYEDSNEIQHYTYDNLPEKIDYVLITHNHQDHLVFESLLQIRHKVKEIVIPKSSGSSLTDPSLKRILRSVGYNNVTEIEDMEAINNESVTITAIPFVGEHGDMNISAKTCYLVTIKGKSILIMADSNNIHPEIYEHVRNVVKKVDVLFLGMECDGAPLTWLYGPLLTKPMIRKMDQSRRFDGSNYIKGMDLVNKFCPKYVFVYAMGQEPWLSYLTSIEYTEQSRPIIESNKLVEDCRGRGLVAERLYGRMELNLETRT